MLDCLVVGYHELDFLLHEQMALSKGQQSAEYGIFQRDHLLVDGHRLPYLDAISYFVNNSERRRGGVGDHWYHITEVPNLAAVYLTSYLRKRGLGAEFVSFLSGDQARFQDLLILERPLAVAVTTTFYLTPLPVIDICSRIRQLQPGAVIIVGGPLINNLVSDLNPDQLHRAFQEMDADVYVRESQGEAALAELVRRLASGHDLRPVPNCYVRQGERYLFTPGPAEDNPLNDNAVDWDLFHDEEMGETVQMRTARSCAFKCSFCDYPVRAGGLSLADLEVVRKELAQLAARGVRNVVFIDDTFNVPESRFRELCRMMIEQRFGLSWFSYCRCSNVRGEDTFDLMAESGCRGVFLGIESADDGVLRNMSKRASADQYRRGIEQLNRRGILSFASFITGFPGERDGSIERAIDLLNDCAPTFYRAEPFWYNPRAPVAREAERFGLRGQGYNWSHDTMDVSEARRAVDRIFDEVTESVWMPMYMFDFWALPYLLGKGMTAEEIRSFLRSAQFTLPGAGRLPVDAAGHSELQTLADNLNLEPARFRRQVSDCPPTQAGAVF